MSSPQPRRSPRLAAQQQTTPIVCAAPQTSNEFFLRRRSLRLEAKRAAAQHQMVLNYKQADRHPHYMYMKSLPEVRECALSIQKTLNCIQGTKDTTEKIKKIITLYDFLLTNRTAHDLFATMPCFRYISLARITEFCEYMPYNTQLRIQRNRLERLYYHLMRHQYYVPEPC